MMERTDVGWNRGDDFGCGNPVFSLLEGDNLNDVCLLLSQPNGQLFGDKGATENDHQIGFQQWFVSIEAQDRVDRV